MTKQGAMLIASIVAIALILLGVWQFDFELSLSRAEKGILLFKHEKLAIREPQSVTVAALRNPLEAGTADKRGYPPVKLSDVAPLEQKRVSLVLIRGERRIAIIDNLVVREGDSINEGRIARIEKGGVLVKNKEGERWLKID